MFAQIRKEITLVKILVILLIIAVSLYLFNILWQFLSGFSDIFAIIVLGWLLGFVLEPLVDKVEAVFHIPRGWATMVVYLLVAGIFTTIVLLLVPIITTQIQTLTRIIPGFLTTAPKFLTRFGDTFAEYLNNSINYLPSVAQFLLSFFITLVISFYLIVDKDRINEEIYTLLPKNWHEEFRAVQELINNSFASFLRVQLIVGLVTGVATWIVLTLANVQFAAATAFVAGVLTIIPLIGPALGLIPTVFVAFIVDPLRALIVLALLLLFQQYTFNILAPKLLGKAFNLHPIVILISFLVGWKIAGGIGALFAIPVLGIAAVVFRDVSHYLMRAKPKQG